MILIAESGSTKTQWNVVGTNKITNTPGLNPFTLNDNEIESIIRTVSVDVHNSKIEKIFFFGAGCSTTKNKIRIKKVLTTIFECNSIEVDTDLKAACIALSGDKPSLIGLMGTGSNSCVWDGKNIITNVPSLGYILGDEGGGVSIGKTLIADYLKGQMPVELQKQFTSKYDITTDLVLERVYKMPSPNRFLASYAPFAEEYITHEYCYNLIYNQFNSFIERNLMNYPEVHKLDTHFCGSIAYYHKDILEKLCTKFNIRLRKVVKEPISELTLHFQNKFL